MKTLKILLVDDQETVLMFETALLDELNPELLKARNAAEALSLLKTNRPDLILLDVMMPVQDGIETCRQIKSNPKTRDIPVIMVTSRGEPERMEAALKAGCDDYVTKPIDKLELLRAIRKSLAKSQKKNK